MRMPELPEVEAIKMQFEKYLVGHTIESVDIKNRKIFTGDEKSLIGAKITGARRFGKVLCIDLSNGVSIVTHIKLTGQFIYRGINLPNPPEISKKVAGGVPGPHTQVIFHFDRESVLYYNDIRRFGWVKLVETSKLKEQNEFVAKLGPEPFRDLTFDYFSSMLTKTKRPVKVVIMDQSKMGGVGNIYANDALWKAKIHPTRPSVSLTPDEQHALYDAIHDVMRQGMKYGGASELAFVTPDGTEGSYQRHTLAYGHTGQLCTRCKQAKFVKSEVGGRGTYTCAVCQH